MDAIININGVDWDEETIVKAQNAILEADHTAIITHRTVSTHFKGTLSLREKKNRITRKGRAQIITFPAVLPEHKGNLLLKSTRKRTLRSIWLMSCNDVEFGGRNQ